MEYLTLALQVLQAAYAAEQDLAPIFAQITAANSKAGGPTDDDMAALVAIEDAQSSELDAPLPDA